MLSLITGKREQKFIRLVTHPKSSKGLDLVEGATKFAYELAVKAFRAVHTDRPRINRIED